MPSAHFIVSLKNIRPKKNRNSIQTGSILLNVCCFSFVFVPTFPSVACFRCRQRPLYRREREKVFGLNTLRRRKILSETALPPDLFAFSKVCTNLMDRQGDRRLTVNI